MIDRWRDERTPIVTVLTIVLAAVVGACGGDGTGSEEAAAEAEATWPSWLAELPRLTVEAGAGEPVWAVVPERGSEQAAVATYRLAAISGTGAALVDALGNRYEEVPGALVHPVSAFPSGELTAGAAVLADRWDAGKVVGRVTRLESDDLELAYDWNGVTTRGAMEVVMPLPAGGDRHVLRWVAFPSPAAAADATWFKGLCFAESEDRLWISADSGYVEIVAKDQVKILSDLGRAELQAGAKVAAYSWGYGYRPGVIAEVLEPGLRYAVELADGETRPFYFADLTTVLG